MMKTLFAPVFCLLLVQAAVAYSSTDLSEFRSLCAAAQLKLQKRVELAVGVCAGVKASLLGVVSVDIQAEVQAEVRLVETYSAALFVEINTRLYALACQFRGDVRFEAIARAVASAQISVHAKIGACLGVSANVKVLGGLVSAGVELSAQVEAIADASVGVFAKIDSAIAALL